MKFRILPVLLLAGGCLFCGRLPESPAQGTPRAIPILQAWQGDYPVALLDRLPPGQRSSRTGYMGTPLSFARVWKAFKPSEKVPPVDFQIACFFPKKGALYHAASREDVRHLLKQKSRFFPENLTREEETILARKSVIARVWAQTFKPVYNFITRRVFDYSDRRNSIYSR